MATLRAAAFVLMLAATAAGFLSGMVAAGLILTGDGETTDTFYLMEHGHSALLMAAVAAVNAALVWRFADAAGSRIAFWIVLAGAALLLAAILPLHTDLLLTPGRFEEIDSVITLRFVGGWLMIAAAACIATGWIWQGVARLARTRG